MKSFLFAAFLFLAGCCEAPSFWPERIVVKFYSGTVIGNYATIAFSLSNLNDGTIHNTQLVGMLRRSGIPVDTNISWIGSVGSRVKVNHLFWDSHKLDRTDSLEFFPLEVRSDEVTRYFYEMDGK